MNNYEDIFKLLNLPNDGSINIDDVIVKDKIKTIHLSRNPIPTYCDVCGARMHSKGIYKRNVNQIKKGDHFDHLYRITTLVLKPNHTSVKAKPHCCERATTLSLKVTPQDYLKSQLYLYIF